MFVCVERFLLASAKFIEIQPLGVNGKLVTTPSPPLNFREVSMNCTCLYFKANDILVKRENFIELRGMLELTALIRLIYMRMGIIFPVFEKRKCGSTYPANEDPMARLNACNVEICVKQCLKRVHIFEISTIGNLFDTMKSIIVIHTQG